MMKDVFKKIVFFVYSKFKKKQKNKSDMYIY